MVKRAAGDAGGGCNIRSRLEGGASVNLRHKQMKNKRIFISDAELERLALERGPTSAEAHVLLELREARSSGDRVSAFETRGHYTIGSALPEK